DRARARGSRAARGSRRRGRRQRTRRPARRGAGDRQNAPGEPSGRRGRVARSARVVGTRLGRRLGAGLLVVGRCPPTMGGPWRLPRRRRAGRRAACCGAGVADVSPVRRVLLPKPPPMENGDSDGARFRLFDIASRFLGAVAGPTGLVVVLDDVHWADRPSLKLLEFIATGLTDTRLLIVATYRDTEVRREDPFCTTLSRLMREPSTRLQIGGLSAGH